MRQNRSRDTELVTMPTLTELEPKNKCPDCLYIKIEGEPVRKNQGRPIPWNRTREQESQKINLFLTICFNEQWVRVPQGRVKLGLRGGELRLELRDKGTIPPDCRKLSKALQLEFSVQREKKTDEKLTTEFKVSSKVPEGSYKRETNNGTSDKFEVTHCQITSKGPDNAPAWVFQEEQGEQVLIGLLTRAELAVVHVIAEPCVITAKFEVSATDIQITNSEGIWQTLIPEKRATLDKALLMGLLKEKLQPYMSMQELRYE